MSEDDVFYTECRDNGNQFYCEYACYDATVINNVWYWSHERDRACDWSACAIDQDVAACARTCALESYNSDVTRQACKWQEVEHSMQKWEWYYDYCVADQDLDWCEWSCTDAQSGEYNWWYSAEELEFACNPSFDDAWRSKRSAKLGQAKVRLAAKGVQAESSNAAYYVAGTYLVGAAAVAFLVMRRKDTKAIETPLLAVDDQFKAQM